MTAILLTVLLLTQGQPVKAERCEVPFWSGILLGWSDRDHVERLLGKGLPITDRDGNIKVYYDAGRVHYDTGGVFDQERFVTVIVEYFHHDGDHLSAVDLITREDKKLKIGGRAVPFVTGRVDFPRFSAKYQDVLAQNGPSTADVNTKQGGREVRYGNRCELFGAESGFTYFFTNNRLSRVRIWAPPE